MIKEVIFIVALAVFTGTQVAGAPFTVPTAWFSLPLGNNEQMQGLHTNSAEIGTDGHIWGNDFILKIADSKNFILSLRQAILTCLDAESINNTFPFVPHVSLGRTLLPAIESFVIDIAKVSKEHIAITTMIKRIKERSEEAVSSMLSHNDFARKITIHTIELYDFDRKCIKKIALA